jgi:hypothetical protein
MRLADKYGVEVEQVGINHPTEYPRVETEVMRRPSLGVYRSWVPSMDEGWTRWVLEQFAFSYTTITDADVRGGKLKDRFDVIILPDQRIAQMIEGNRADSYPEEYCGGMTDAGVANLKRFVEDGGVLICLDSASELAIKKLGLPVKNVLEGLRRDQFYAPGSILSARVDKQNPIGYGMPSEADLYFVSGTSRAPEPDVRRAPETRSSQESVSDSEARQSETRQGGSGGRDSLSESRAVAGTELRPESRQRGADGRGSGSGTRANRRDDSSTLVNAQAFEITDPQRVRSVARYIDGNPLRSGWLLGPSYVAGKSALVDVSMGKGRVVLFGFRVQHRAQTWGTFKLLFNAILLGGSLR